MTLATPPALCAPAPGGAVLTQVGFTDTLPPGLVLASPPNATNTCGGTLAAAAGASTFGLASAGLAAGQACTVTVSVTAVGLGLQSNVIARTGGSTTASGYFNAQFASALSDASATLVVGAPSPQVIPASSLPVLILLGALLALAGATRLRKANR